MMIEDDMIINKEKKMYNWDDVWNKWGDLKCLQKPTNQMEIEGGLFPDTVLDCWSTTRAREFSFFCRTVVELFGDPCNMAMQ